MEVALDVLRARLVKGDANYIRLLFSFSIFLIWKVAYFISETIVLIAHQSVLPENYDKTKPNTSRKDEKESINKYFSEVFCFGNSFLWIFPMQKMTLFSYE